jgi:hypothetical protein
VSASDSPGAVSQRGGGGTGGASLVTVRLLELPVPLHQRVEQHGQELQREMALLAVQLESEGEHGALPPRLMALMRDLSSDYAGIGDAASGEIEAAADAGRESVDVTYRVPDSVGPAARHLAAVLDEADEYCRRGRHLLTLAAPPDQVAYRHWFCGQFTDQVTGAPPVPWPAYAAQHL